MTESEETKNTRGMRFKAFAKRTGIALLGFVKVNYLMFAYIFVSVIMELTAIAVTADAFYMAEPWIYFTLIGIVCLISQYLPGHKSRYVLFLLCMIANFVIDLVFIVVFKSTNGTIFDYAMLTLRNDAATIVESLPMSFTYIFVSSLLLMLYAVLGFMARRYMPAPNLKRSAAITTSALASTVICLNILLSFIANYRYDSNDLSYMLTQNETGTYKNKGVVGNFYNELVRGLWFSDIDVGNEEELSEFIFAKISEPTPLTGRATSENGIYNVVTVLCESLEWFAFVYDPDRYPNGFAKYIDNSDAAAVAQLKYNLKYELFPNIYKLYENEATVVLDNSHSLEKTDISENKAIIGNYPLYEYINYSYPENTLPFSMPNMLRSLYGIESRSFHDGLNTFYNRNVHHVKALGFDSFTSSEQMALSGDDGEFGERNLDSEMMESCKAQMFPTDKTFNTFITTITQHGQYAYRDNLKPYYDKLDSLNMLPYSEDNDEANALRFYCAAGMDLDKAIGIMLDYLDEKGLADHTLITLFSDHNCYYQGLSNYVKNIYTTDSPNYTELFRVPVMIKIGKQNINNTHIKKFTCVLDIYPTIADLLGITVFSNLTYGTSVFSEQESLLYSRAYNKFMTDKIYFNTLSTVNYMAPGVDNAYIQSIRDRGTTLLNKISHINRLYAGDFLKGSREKEFYSKLKGINEPTLN